MKTQFSISSVIAFLAVLIFTLSYSAPSQARTTVSATPLASAARTATAVSLGFSSLRIDWCYVLIDVTAETGVPDLTVEIQGEFPTGSGVWFTLGTTPSFLPVGPGKELSLFGSHGTLSGGVGSSDVNNYTSSLPFSTNIRVRVVHATGDSVTYVVTRLCGIR